MALIPTESLCRHCDVETLKFETTAELEDLTETIGQDRAVEAIEFGLAMSQPGYNVFALGPPGIGRHQIVRKFVDARAEQAPVPSDWCYVNNFKEAHKPRAIQLPAGKGAALKVAMDRLIDDLRSALSTAFSSDEYRTRRRVIEDEFKDKQQSELEEVEKAAAAKEIALVRTPMGYAFAPTRDGKIIKPDEFESLAEEQREEFKKSIEQLEKQLQAVVQKFPAMLQEIREKVRKLNEDTASFAVGHMIDRLRSSFSDIPEVVEYLEEVGKDVVDNVETIMSSGEESGEQGGNGSKLQSLEAFRRYRVNLFVDHGEAGHAPVVYEDEPTFERLIGRIEHRVQFGALFTDFNLIRSGALHRANGGYLLIDARKLLTQPASWEALKRVLRAREIRIEPIYGAMGLPSTTMLEPETIPCDLKIALIGERLLYYLLADLDPEFREHFKVIADFDDVIDRDGKATDLFPRLIATTARREGMPDFDRRAVAGLSEYVARLAGHAGKLSSDIEALTDLMQEASHFARKADRSVVTQDDVQNARDAQIRRHDRLNKLLQEQIIEETVVVDTDGESVGQINGLSVLQIGQTAFGKPSRISARIRMGRGNVVDIEREVKLGGPLHSKGVLILSSYLGATYLPDKPLSLSASLVFEQSYGGVDGDSASSAELYALISALSGVPINQSFAVTGSVDQNGRVQAIGGVNEKIEGYFDVCAARGLTGRQGVLIPASNVKHLMLHQRVVQAVRDGKFSIHAVSTIDEGIELLTGVPAGARGEDGKFPDGAIGQRVEAKLLELAEARKAFVQTGEPELR
ncbi:MAG TPA: ATP-binding protein [Alphaproteobacteria bacterium]|nr:ATP-binding protein [Alphaproteobacteria bacterium]